MNEKTNKAGATSGQNVPKSKFRHKSQQEQTAASKLRMEKRGEKLEKAKEKLAKQKPPKPPGPVRRVAGTVGGGVHGYVHGKMFEVEQENVGTEGAHRSELVGESVLRHGMKSAEIAAEHNYNMIDGVLNNQLPALPPEQEKELDKVKEPPNKRRSREREER